MINVNVVDMYSSQRSLQKLKSRIENCVGVHVTGQLHQVDGEIRQKDMVSQMKRL